MIGVNEWLNNSCVVVAKDDPSCYDLLNHIESMFYIFETTFRVESITVES
jgi:hypothetical protein